MFTALIGPIANLAGTWFENKLAKTKADGEAKVAEKENSQTNIIERFNPKIDDVATILYTSGTTGKPKGVPLTHANFLHQIINLAYIADPEPGTSVLSVLPIWHSYERSAR